MRRFLLAGCIGLLASSAVRADDLVFAAADGRSSGQRVADVQVTRIDGDTLFYKRPNGVESQTPLMRVLTIALPNDPAFTAAETAYAGGDAAGAIDHYLKAIRTNDAWKVRRIAPRLIESAGVTKRFDAAMAGYIAYARVAPAAAAGSKPALPPKGSAFLEDAARQLDAATKAATNDAEKQALLALALAVQMAREDQTAAQAIADQLAKLSAANPTAAGESNVAQLSAGVKLSQARLAVQARRFAEALTTLDAAGDGLKEPRQVAEGLYLRAQAMAGLAPAGDRNARLDVAAAYLRVVATASANEAEPFVSDSLLRAAETLAEAGDTDGASTLCEQIAAEFPNTPAAAAAATLGKRLAAAK